MKSNVQVKKTTSWLQTYFRESIKTFNAKVQIPRLANFPQDDVLWEEITAREAKFGDEAIISLEDSKFDVVDVMKRTAIRMAHRLTQRVDTSIWNMLSDNQSAVDIQTLATSATWDNATRASRIPHEDLLEARQLISGTDLQAYRADTVFVSPKDLTFLASNDYIMSSWDASGPALMKSGHFANLWNMKIVESPVVTADYALVCQAKVALTYKEAVGLQTSKIEDPGKATTLRAWEIGVSQLTDPKDVVLITNTQA